MDELCQKVSFQTAFECINSRRKSYVESSKYHVNQQYHVLQIVTIHSTGMAV